MAAARRYGPAFPPANEIPGTILAEGLIARSEQVVLRLADIEVYSNGLAFTLHARARAATTPLTLDRFGRPHPTTASPPVLIGTQDSAGTIGTNLPKMHTPLRPRGGGAAAATAWQGFFLSPPPAPGPLTIIVAWPFFDLPETRLEIDGDQLAAATARVEVLWPPADTTVAPDPTADGQRAPTPDPPAGGWFAAAAANYLPPPPPAPLPPGHTRVNFAYITTNR